MTTLGLTAILVFFIIISAYAIGKIEPKENSKTYIVFSSFGLLFSFSICIIGIANLFGYAPFEAGYGATANMRDPEGKGVLLINMLWPYVSILFGGIFSYMFYKKMQEGIGSLDSININN